MRSARSITLSYVLIATTWIALTDALVNIWAGGPARAVFLNVGKGLLFVSVTSGGLFVLVRAHLVHIRAAERYAERVERMRRLGEVAAGIAHDFNNILMMCRSAADVIRRTASDDRTTRAALLVAEAVRRGQALTDEVLAFGSTRPPALAHVPLAEFLESVAEELRTAFDGMAIETSAASESLAIRADPDQLRRVLTNLVTNAGDAMNGNGRVTIAARPSAGPPREIAELLDPAGDFVEIAVTDTGPGIPADMLPRLFEPMFTTKRTGTGLGLPIVQRIVDEHRGCVTVASRAGAGATFTLLFPASRAN